MDDFLGTSIQYSEYQIKLLEKEHYENQQKIVEELISSGFLDSDYEDTTTDNESEASSSPSLEIKENNLTESESPLIESVDDSKLNISPTSLVDDSSTSTSIEVEEELSSSPSSITMINNEDLALVLGSDISVVDESNVSNSESIDDASINNQIIHSQQYRQYRYRQYNDIDNDTECKVQENEYEYENENHYDSDEQIQEIQQFDIVTSKAIIRFMEVIFSDIKYLMILFILMIAMPHIIERAHIENDDGMQQFYGGGHAYHGQHGRCQQAQYQYQTEIHWTLDTATTTQAIINDEDDERDEYQENDDDINTDQTKSQCKNTPHILKFDIIQTKLDKETGELRGHLLHREFPFNPSDCNGKGNGKGNKFRMRIPTEMPGLFMKIGGLGGGFKSGPQMMRIFKETSVITSVGRHFTRSHGLYALVMAFVGIAGFAASNGIDEIITINSS